MIVFLLIFIAIVVSLNYLNSPSKNDMEEIKKEINDLKNTQNTNENKEEAEIETNFKGGKKINIKV